MRAAFRTRDAVCLLCLAARRRRRPRTHPARLGHEANDALDEFLELALNYESKAPASLQGFMAWLRAADTEVKRDMEISRDEVRVMTVHGAKGLEAPVVIHGRHHVIARGHPAAPPDPFAARQRRRGRGLGRAQGR